jgi:uncharacterized protein YxeA
MKKLLAIVPLVLLVGCGSVLYAQNNGQLNLNQSQIDSYRAEKRSYNTIPGRENDAHNQYLNNQIERYSRDRDQIINQNQQQNQQQNYQRGDRGRR